ncbi:NACHT domain-containing protein [Falsihalocynthiibacter sp. CO-5D18]|uniref:NACHT domain-containing protein n=1 Tax=Falsihalocynthiibacter sp. CO-5D18 TaxID=3240872 RepID=UPI00350ECA2E
MAKATKQIDTVRASRAGHTFHERWAARRALQLVFPKDNLFSIIVEGLSPNEEMKLGREAEEIADLILFYGGGDTFATCSSQQILQFKYKAASDSVTSSYLKKTIKKFAATLRDYRKSAKDEEISEKLSFGFVTNAEFSDDLWSAISCLKSGALPKAPGAAQQLRYLKEWCHDEQIVAEEIFPLIEFRASTIDLPSQNRTLRRTVSDWSAESAGHAAKRLFALTELVREKSQIEGQGRNSIRREDVLDALECDEDQLFPAETRFVGVTGLVERDAIQAVKRKIIDCSLPVFLHADGGVGKTVFIQSLASSFSDTFEVVIFDCFGGGGYRSEAQARHLPKVGLLQIINELATRGLCDPLLPTDGDQIVLVSVARKRLKQASETVKTQSSLRGVLVVLDAADNAQLEANARDQTAFPRLLLASLSEEPIDGVKLLLTARPHRMDSVVGNSQTESFELKPFSREETRQFLASRRKNMTDVEFSTALARSQGNARVLEYLDESWDINVSGSAIQTEISVEALIAEKCDAIFRDLHLAGWNKPEVHEFFAALSLLPPPIPLNELAKALGWSESQINSAASDLAPMLELVKHGAIFRDEPTETYIKDQYAGELAAQQSIAQRLQDGQQGSIYAAEALPHFLVVIGDGKRAYELAFSDQFPAAVASAYGQRRLKLVRLNAAFSLATRDTDLDRVLSLAMQLSQVASANARGDEFIRRSPALATILGDSDASRRLFNDRSGWRGARDTRLIVAYSFSEELDEARIHQQRAIGWLNWYLNNNDEDVRHKKSGYGASDIAAVIFLNVLENNFSSFNRNMKIWNSQFARSVVDELVSLCAQYEIAVGGKPLQNLAEFAASKKCESITLQIGLLSTERGLHKSKLKAVSRAASVLSLQMKNKSYKDNHDHHMELQGSVTSAAMSCLIVNSRQSAQRLFGLSPHRRPSSYDYGERHGMSRIWSPVYAACVAAWSSGEALSFRHLLPNDVKMGQKAKSITTEAELGSFLDSLTVIKHQHNRRKPSKPEKQKQFSHSEQESIVKGAACVLKLAQPIEAALFAKETFSNETLASFLAIWKTVLRPDIHWRAEGGRDETARRVGIGFARVLLRYCDHVEKSEAEELIAIVGANRFSVSEKLGLLSLIARRSNLADVTGAFATSLSGEILKDDFIEQRGDSYRDLALSLLPMSTEEAREYYAQGLSQLDQMGSDDFDLVYSILHYAAEQPGGWIKPKLSHRLMNLCHTIFQHEPSKFGWTLFGRATASSVGLPAIYKLMRWNDQDVVDYSYGLPQLACLLSKEGRLDPRRAAVLLTLCEDHGWHEWQVGTGLKDLLSVAKPESRKAIFSLVSDKLEGEHSFGGWEGLWESQIDCIEAFDELNENGLKDRLQGRREAARIRRDVKNARNSSHQTGSDFSFQVDEDRPDKQANEDAFNAIVAQCDPASVLSLDKSIQDLQGNKQLDFGSRQRLLEEIQRTCPYEKRVKFLEAICESTELSFEAVLELMIQCVETWSSSTTHVRNGTKRLIEKFFAFKGSELFNLRYSGIPRQISRMSQMYDDPKFVMQTVIEIIAKERLELSGDEWLQVATALSTHATPSAALDAFENLLSSPAANVGDEIGEGAYRAAFVGKDDEGNLLADIIWHLLGSDDAFVRWNAGRSIKGMLDVGLVKDVGCLIDCFDQVENPALASEDHHFAFLNAQQWLLMGLARAALHHGDKLMVYKSKLATLLKRADLHALNRLHLLRCLKNIEGKVTQNPELEKLWEELETPPQGVIERDGWPQKKQRRLNFDFDYEFNKYKVSELARLFGISENEAIDCIADDVVKRWPNAKDMNDFPGKISYSYDRDDRYESYREHVQRHAFISAATQRAKIQPVVRNSCDSEDANPWRDFLKELDVSFRDGSWLSDHKDNVPKVALEHLLGERKGYEETLVAQDKLLAKVGLSPSVEDQFLPLYGHWKSVDGVYVSYTSALTRNRGMIGQCASLAKLPDHELWLPRFGSDGRSDRFSTKSAFAPLIWDPETYPIGIDASDEWATRGAIARPRLGHTINKALGLRSDENDRRWLDSKGSIALKSEVWGSWKPDGEGRGGRYQDEGEILWANREWLDEILKTCRQSLAYRVSFSKYKSSKSYDETSGVKEVYVGLKRYEQDFRFWFAKNASKTVY